MLMAEHPDRMTVSEIDNKPYTVKENYTDHQTAANILSKLNHLNSTLIDHLKNKYGDSKISNHVEFLAGNYDGDVLQEHTPRTTVNTSYVLNKGDLIKLCLRDQVTGDFHDYDTLVFVNLHELSHLLDLAYGHNKSFWTGFKFILEEAQSIGLYTPVDYEKTPVGYCGIEINNNPYFNRYPGNKFKRCDGGLCDGRV
jgi:hypothetical protein